MTDYVKERNIQRKREYHREWRKKHPESVKAAQMRYWTKKAAEMNNPGTKDNSHVWSIQDSVRTDSLV